MPLNFFFFYVRLKISIISVKDAKETKLDRPLNKSLGLKGKQRNENWQSINAFGMEAHRVCALFRIT